MCDQTPPNTEGWQVKTSWQLRRATEQILMRLVTPQHIGDTADEQALYDRWYKGRAEGRGNTRPWWGYR